MYRKRDIYMYSSIYRYRYGRDVAPRRVPYACPDPIHACGGFDAIWILIELFPDHPNPKPRKVIQI